MSILCKPFGVYAPNTKFQATSCYKINHKNKIIILDCGIGVAKKLIEDIIIEKVSPEDITIVISHNHVDHVAGILTIGNFMMKFFPFSKINLFVSNTSGKFGWYEKIVKNYSSVFSINVIEKMEGFGMSDLTVEFCPTDHCKDGAINSFATRISDKCNSFVYTSDIATINENLKGFIKDADLVMVDAGNPVKRVKTLKGYHGDTGKNVFDILDCGVRGVYLTHLKGCFEKADYIDSLSEDCVSYTFFAEKNIKFNIFTGEKESKYVEKTTSIII